MEGLIFEISVGIGEVLTSVSVGEQIAIDVQPARA